MNDNKNPLALTWENDSLWSFLYGTRSPEQERNYREHFLKEDTQQALAIAWAAVAFMSALSIRDVLLMDVHAELLAGIQIRVVTTILALWSIWRLMRGVSARQLDEVMLVLGLSGAATLLSVHLVQEVTAVRMGTIGVFVILSVIVGSPTYPMTTLVAVLMIMVGDGYLLFLAPEQGVDEAGSLIMVLYVFSALFAVIFSAHHHRTRFHAHLANSEVRTLHGMLPICSHCKKIRDDSGYYQQLEAFISTYSEATFSHGICPDCVTEYYPEMRPEGRKPV